MSSIKLTADSGGGTFEIKAPSSSGNTRVLTLPDTGNATVLTTDTSVGKILQVVQATTTDVASFSTSSSFVDGGLGATITPSAASSKILVQYRYATGQSAGNVRSTRLARSINSGSYSEVTNVRAHAYAGNTQSTSQIHLIDLTFLDTPSYSLGQPVAYRVEVNSYNTTLYRNQYGAGTGMGAMISTMILMEVAT